MLDNLQVVGRVHYVLTDENGNVKAEGYRHNNFVKKGLERVASRFALGGTAGAWKLSVGKGSSATVGTMTALEDEAGQANVTNPAVTENKVAYTATFGAGVATGALTEAGLHNNEMMARLVFPVLNKAAADSLTLTWTVEFKNS